MYISNIPTATHMRNNLGILKNYFLAHSLTQSYIRPSIHSLTHLSTPSLSHTVSHQPIKLSTRPPTHSLIHPFISHPPAHPPTHSSTRSPSHLPAQTLTHPPSHPHTLSRRLARDQPRIETLRETFETFLHRDVLENWTKCGIGRILGGIFLHISVCSKRWFWQTREMFDAQLGAWASEKESGVRKGDRRRKGERHPKMKAASERESRHPDGRVGVRTECMRPKVRDRCYRAVGMRRKSEASTSHSHHFWS